MDGNSHAFFANRDCAYFPCHKGVRDGDFNCLFCYCPLYARGEKCGGGFTFAPSGVKDCSGCVFPHVRANYSLVVALLSDSL